MLRPLCAPGNLAAPFVDTLRPMRRRLWLPPLALVLSACLAGTEPTVSPPSSTSPTSTTLATTTSSVTTTSHPSDLDPLFDVTGLSATVTCSLDEVPSGGEATVAYQGRLYGLGADWGSPRCLIDDLRSTDIAWGPEGDRVRIGDQVHGQSQVMTIGDATSLEWTAPTGTRIVGVNAERVWKVDVDGTAETDITFLETTDDVAYHPAGTHVLAIGTDSTGQYGLWLATNEGLGSLLIASDGAAVISEAAWSWLGEPLFVAAHQDGTWHIHRVELSAEGSLEGPIVVEAEDSIDRLLPARHDPVMLAYRSGAEAATDCVDGARAMVNGVDLPEPLSGLTSTPVGWLSAERLLVLAYPDGCDAPADLWSFSAGFCPGSEYGATLIVSGIDGAAARETAPSPPPPPDFTGIIDPAPA